MAQDYRCFFRIAVILPRTVVDLFVYFQVVTNLIPPGTISAEYSWKMFVLFGNTFQSNFS